jgi:hypothetical protein
MKHRPLAWGQMNEQAERCMEIKGDCVQTPNRSREDEDGESGFSAQDWKGVGGWYELLYNYHKRKLRMSVHGRRVL